MRYRSKAIWCDPVVTLDKLFSTPCLSWLESVLEERFGHRFSLSQHGGRLDMRLGDAPYWLCFDSLITGFHLPHADMPSINWDAAAQGYSLLLGQALPAPGIATLPAKMIEQVANGYVVHYDLLGLTYWMLARVEEVTPAAEALDEHHRFPATSSHAFKHGYLERPVVDEWLHILGQVIQRTWPQIVLKQHSFSVKVSHDVDQPTLYAFKSWGMIVRMMAGHLIKRRDLKAFVTAPYVKLATHHKLISADPFNTFDWLMDVSEANNVKSAFYFICGRSDATHDADYDPGHPIIRNLMRRIHQRGHEIGLHPSYNTYQNPQSIEQEAGRLKCICAEEGIEQAQWGGRMHYLRWEQPTTLRAWADAGLTYDSTLGYADGAGFRCGTCFEYPAFDPVAEESLALRIRPLIMMEGSVISDAYMGLGTGSLALQASLNLKNTCKRVGGQFTLLWHNSALMSDEDKRLFSDIVATK